MFRAGSLALILAVCVAQLSSAWAGLIIDPTLGTPRLTGAVYGANDQIDDLIVNGNLNLAGSFKFFGQTLSTLRIGTNGNLNANPNTLDSFFPKSFAAENPGLLIAPLWDDMVFVNPDLYPTNPAVYGTNPPVNQIFESIAPGQYYGVTWHNARLFQDLTYNNVGQLVSFPQSLMSVQALLIVADTTLRGVAFQANDIVFGYVSKTGTTGDFGTLEAEVGLNSPTNQFSILRPDLRTNAGMLTNAQAATVLPWQDNAAVLFRPVQDGLGNFQSYQIQSITLAAVPEPVTWLWYSAMAGGLAVRRWYWSRSAKQVV